MYPKYNGTTRALCPICGARRESHDGACSFCRGPSQDGSGRPSVTRSVHDATAAWGQTVFGAPRGLDQLITAIDVQDEVFERLATEYITCPLREERVPTKQRGASAPRVDPRTVDPFRTTPSQLRAESEYVAPCMRCNGAGTAPCHGCGGTGRAPCAGCGGSGKELKHYQRSSRLINCKACRGRGDARCVVCSTRGHTSCNMCLGSGYQLAWLTYERQTRWSIVIAPNEVVRIYPHLAEHRFLVKGDLVSFQVVAEEISNGRIQSGGVSKELLRAAESTSHTERIHRQQYIKFVMVKREVRFSLSGTTGALVLAGNDLRPSHSGRALGAIRARMYAWVAMGAALAVLTGALLSELRGSGPYYARSNDWLVILWLVAMAATLPLLGALLRAVGPGFRFRGLRRFEKWLAAFVGLAFAALIAVGLAARPRSGEVSRDLANGNVAHARLVIDALKALRSGAADVREAEDAVVLAEAQTAQGESRWKMLGDVAARNGSRATEAAKMVRAERLAEARRLFGEPASAVAAIERWFPSAGKGDPEIAEALASAYEHAGEQCANDACRLQAALQAEDAASSPPRTQRIAEARTRLLASFQPAEAPGEGKLARLRRLRAMAESATRTLEFARNDEELTRRAKETQTWASAERAKVAVLGSDRAIAEELFEKAASSDGKHVWIPQEETRIYLSLDATGTCRGLYVVGATEKSRAIEGTAWTAERILARAMGRPSAVKRPADGATSIRWNESTVPVVEVELRIGDANPAM
ncbi:hypothetical protein LZC95_33760 [Pendulispora brunnea]|uniref:CR-type domain-containing protein n=1 Tax=Pendulispora brunnea TaxID=2905690 RepID=A0ABZ2JY70_9BACT